MATQTSLQSGEDLIELFDNAPLDARYWRTFILMSGLQILDFFDFFLIAFVMAVIGPRWHLTYGEGALILYCAGVGAIIGALAWGSIADVFGRKMQTVSGTFICGLSAGLIGVLPSGAWGALAVLRFFVGFGLAAGVTPALTIVVEVTPTRWRTGLASFYLICPAIGTLLASFTAAALLHTLGWRAVAMTGFVAIVFGILVWIFVPESVRWLTAKGRFAEARAQLAKQLRMPIERIPQPTARPASPPRANLGDLYANPRLFWQTVIIWSGSATAAYGYYLWGPTIAALALHVSPVQAAKYFIYVSLGGLTGRVFVSLVAPKAGRRPIGALFGVGSMAGLALAGYYHAALISGVPVFIVLVIVSAFFVEGGFANLAPYTIEQYGVSRGSRSSGLGQAANGVGKIVGPLVLAVLAGSGNLIAPQATAAAVLPAFIFLGAYMLAVGLAYVFLGVETRGREMALGD